MDRFYSSRDRKYPLFPRIEKRNGFLTYMDRNLFPLDRNRCNSLPMEPITKSCSRCLSIKELSEFAHNPHGIHQRHSSCRGRLRFRRHFLCIWAVMRLYALRAFNPCANDCGRGNRRANGFRAHAASKAHQQFNFHNFIWRWHGKWRRVIWSLQ